MSDTRRWVSLGLAGIVAIGVTVAGCATPWFGNAKKAQPQAAAAPQPPADSATDLKRAAISYINGLCKLPKEQHDSMVRDLNEALLPNHAAISCGRAGGT